MKYFVLICSMCLLTSCQVVTQKIASEFNEFKQSIREDFDRSTFNSIQNKLARLDFVGALEKIEKLRSNDLKMEAYLNTATDICLNPEHFKKYRTEFHFALGKCKEYIPDPESGDLHFHSRILHCELLFRDSPQEASALMDVITKDVSAFSDPYIQAKYLNRICFKQSDLFQNIEKARDAAQKSEKAITQVQSPEKRAELLINLIDKDLSIFKDVQTAKRLISYLEKTLNYISYEPERKNQEASFRKIKSKHNLLLCEFEE